jgi:hypothetical protein
LLSEAATAQRQQNLRNHILVPSDQQQAKVEASTIGLAVGVTVNNQHILRASSACSISHVVWEQQPQDDAVIKQ